MLLCRNALSFFFILILTAISWGMGLLLYFDETKKRNVNPGLSHFERCALACARLLVNLHICFAFHQSKATLPMYFFGKYCRPVC